jgi:hypothetical protein
LTTVTSVCTRSKIGIDLFSALAGISEADARELGRIAGELHILVADDVCFIVHHAKYMMIANNIFFKDKIY